MSWTLNRKTTFNKLKNELANAIFLAFPDPSAQFAVQIDASGSASGAATIARSRIIRLMTVKFFLQKAYSSIMQLQRIRSLLAIYAAIKHFPFMLEKICDYGSQTSHVYVYTKVESCVA